MKTNRLSAATPGLCAAALLVTFCAAVACGAPFAPLDPDLPVARLFDAGASLPDPLPARPPTDAWAPVPEGATAYAFRGDAVALNNRVALVARTGSAGVQLYSRSADGLRLRAMLSPVAAGGAVRGVQVAENSPGAAALQVAFGTGSTVMTFRITTGDVKVETRCTAGLALRCDARWAVVPDFFANDMVFDAGAFEGERLGLPAENFFLGLLDGFDCMLMSVWDAPGRDADLLASAAPSGRTIAGWDIAGAEGARTWVAVLEGPGMWHEGAVPAGTTSDLTLSWTPPFAAKWRADVLSDGPLALSVGLGDGTGDEGEGPAGPACACTVADGQTLLGLATGWAGRVVVYPIDRSRTTPLSAFCPIDVLRTALGVGPCQYILAMEGIDVESHPTPADVTHWIEQQFKRGRDGRQAEAIRQRLDQMVSHVGHTQDRIGLYRQFARDVRGTCSERRTGPAAPAAELLARTADDMERAVGADDAAGVPEDARRLAAGIAALIGQADAAGECAKLGAELRALGAAQDRALAGGRMAVRWLRQQCRTVAASDPAGAELATQLQARAEAMLGQQ